MPHYNSSPQATASANATLGGCWGCLSTILFVILIWFLLFGVTVGGVHYALSCSTDKGVTLQSSGDAQDLPDKASEGPSKDKSSPELPDAASVTDEGAGA